MRRSTLQYRYFSPPPRRISLRLRHFFQATLKNRAVIATAIMIVSAWAPPEMGVPGTEFHASAGEINIFNSYSQSAGIILRRLRGEPFQPSGEGRQGDTNTGRIEAQGQEAFQHGLGFESDPEAKIAKMKDGTTHLAYKPGHAVDLDTGAVVAAELHPADEGDITTLPKTLAKAEANLEAVDAAPTSEDPAECVADKGYHSRAVLRALNDSPWKTRIAAPKQTGFSRWHGDEAARRAVTNNRARLKSGVAREAFKLRAEIVERCFAHNLDRGGMRRTWLRGRENVHKRYLLHIAGHNLSLLMRQLIGADTPREAVAGGYGGIFVLLTPTRAMLVARGGSQSGQTAFAAAFLIWE